MNRPRNSWTNPRTTLTLACVLAGVIAITPWRFSAWVQAPANLVSMFVSPIQYGFTKVLSPIAVKRRSSSSGDAADTEVLRTRYLQLEQENRQLRAQIEALQNGVKVSVDLGTPRVITRSLGLRGSLLQLRTDHVQPQPDGTSPIGKGSVVVIDGVNIVGRVVSPGGIATLAELVTDVREIKGVIRPVEAGQEVIEASNRAEYRVLLNPTGNGRLTGSVYLTQRPVGGSMQKLDPVKVGARVRLADPDWPRFAQMLIVGEVESVQTAQNDRQVVVVRPMYEVKELAGDDFTLLIQPPLPEVATPPVPEKPKGGRK